ncbi:hypothetical protein NPIL_103651 [Nephila pilipes]|uniref:Uncharacterized protein n=1 Tax=Nephila pilipes TaxID=299642 RepID=A0A8X6U5W5_NEPPI|nr:hypothetical protein NPIL_103651 [Nephila pilipes]
MGTVMFSERKTGPGHDDKRFSKTQGSPPDPVTIQDSNHFRCWGLGDIPPGSTRIKTESPTEKTHPGADSSADHYGEARKN